MTREQTVGGILLGFHLSGQVAVPLLFTYSRRRREDLGRVFVVAFAGSWLFQSVWDAGLLFFILLTSAGVGGALVFGAALGWMAVGALIAFTVLVRLIPARGSYFT